MTGFSGILRGRLLGPLLLLCLSILLVAGCSTNPASESGGKTAQSGQAEEPAQAPEDEDEDEEFDGRVALSTFKLELDVKSFKTGHVMFEVKNNADIKHELAIYQTDLQAAELPINTKLNKVDSQGKGVQKISEVVVEPGTAAHLGAELLPGRYLAICNFPGHFAKGMVTAFQVR